METSDSKYFWNIGTEANPIIQGQAGKPFYHAPGGCIQLPYMEYPIKNDCLCQYPYMQYFWVYAKLVHKDSIQFLDLDAMLHNRQVKARRLSDSIWPVSIVSDSGWQWQLVKWSDSSYYRYAGCHSSTTSPTQLTGQWIGLFSSGIFASPYTKKVTAGSYTWNTTQPNLSYPSPSQAYYRYGYNCNAPWCVPYQYIRYRRNTGPYTLMCMLVSNYRCCNGQLGCGQAIQHCLPVSSDSLTTYSCQYAVMDNTEQCTAQPRFRVDESIAKDAPSFYLSNRRQVKGTRNGKPFVFFIGRNTNTSAYKYRPASVSISNFRYFYVAQYIPNSDSISWSSVVWDGCAPQEFTHFRFLSDSISIAYPCNIPDPPRFKYRNIKQNQQSKFTQVQRTKLNLYRFRYIDSVQSDSDCCSRAQYKLCSDSQSLFIEDIQDDQILEYITQLNQSYYNTGTPIVKDGKAYLYYLAAQRSLLNPPKSVYVSRDIQCPVYFALYISSTDTQCVISDSQDSESLSVQYMQFCGVQSWTPLGYLPKRITRSLPQRGWLSGTHSRQLQPYQSSYSSRTYTYIAKMPPGTQYICNDQVKPQIHVHTVRYIEGQSPDFYVHDVCQTRKMPQSWQSDALTIRQMDVLCIPFYCDLSDSWDDTILLMPDVTKQQKVQCYSRRNTSGDGSAQNPWRNLHWALSQLSGLLHESGSPGCGLRIILYCTGTARYSVAFDRNFPNLILYNAHIQVTRTINISSRVQYSMLKIPGAYLDSCSLKGIYPQCSFYYYNIHIYSNDINRLARQSCTLYNCNVQLQYLEIQYDQDDPSIPLLYANRAINSQFKISGANNHYTDVDITTHYLYGCNITARNTSFALSSYGSISHIVFKYDTKFDDNIRFNLGFVQHSQFEIMFNRPGEYHAGVTLPGSMSYCNTIIQNSSAKDQVCSVTSQSSRSPMYKSTLQVYGDNILLMTQYSLIQSQVTIQTMYSQSINYNGTQHIGYGILLNSQIFWSLVYLGQFSGARFPGISCFGADCAFNSTIDISAQNLIGLDIDGIDIRPDYNYKTVPIEDCSISIDAKCKGSQNYSYRNAIEATGVNGYSYNSGEWSVKNCDINIAVEIQRVGGAEAYAYCIQYGVPAQTLYTGSATASVKATPDKDGCSIRIVQRQIQPGSCRRKVYITTCWAHDDSGMCTNCSVDSDINDQYCDPY